MNNTNRFVDKKNFEILCINDYMHFIYSFYFTIFINDKTLISLLKNSLIALSDQKIIDQEIRSDNERISINLNQAMEPELINKWFSSLKSINIDPKEIFAGELFIWLFESNKMTPLGLPIKSNTSKRREKKQINIKVNIQKSGEDDELNNKQFEKKPKNNTSGSMSNNIGFFSNAIKRREERKKTQINQKNIIVKIPESVEEEYNTNKLYEFNNKQFEKNLKNNTSGAMSNILVSPDRTQLFKQLKPGYKKYHSNECKVYNLLKQKLSTKTIDDLICFIQCYKNGILLRYGGISLYQMIKDKKVPNKEWFKTLFDKINLIHLVGIAHNDLHPKNIVGDGKEESFLIDFGLAKISDTDIDEDTGNFLEFIDDFFFNFFFIFSSNINTLAEWFT